jgi:hypothetical protein
MKTHQALLTAQAAFLGLTLTLAGCSSGSGSGSSGGNMYIESCSLGCGNADLGDPIGCSLTEISQNAEVTIQFSEPVNLSSVNAGSFRLVNLNDGTVPSGVFTIDPTDSRRLVFRPSLVFTGAGNPEFGFDPNETYEIRVLGEGQDPDGPFIRSTANKNNQTRMVCTVQTTLPLIDPVPGAPSFTGYVTDELNPTTGAVMFDSVTNLPVGGVPLNGSTGLETTSRVVLIFDDVMNKATIANQLNGLSNTITVQVKDPGSDPVTWPGIWIVDVDFDNLLRTVATFTPVGGEFPPGGSDPLNPRQVLVDVSNQLLDIVGNVIENPGLSTFSTIVQTFDEELLTEDFTTNDNEDSKASGATWGGGKLTYGPGGGSGRLGPLSLTSGDLLELNTDSQDFPLPDQVESILSNLDPGTDYDPLDPASWPTITIDQFGQAFEFTSVDIGLGATVVITGSQAGRIFSRGELILDGVIDLTGETPAAHVSNLGGSQPNNPFPYIDSIFGGPGGSGGPAAGAGGQGADRMDMTDANLPVMQNVGGVVWPVGSPAAVNDGRSGGGVGGLPTGTGGVGGLRWPSSLPLTNSPDFGNEVLYGNAELSDIFDDGNTCRIAMVGGPGSGGSHAFPGTVGLPGSPYTAVFPGLISNLPTPTPGGDNSALDLEAPGSIVGPTAKRNLEFWRKHLNGGSGGGGGGTHVYGSRHNAALGPNCSSGGGLFPFWDHSAAGGGGGGGAVMLTAGTLLRINGQIDCTGGDGGSSTLPGASIALCTASGQIAGQDPDCEKYASPGGGGAGGSVRLQATTLEFSSVPERILVNGGVGGLGVGSSSGGDGSAGLVRMEYEGFVSQVADALIWAPLVSPYDPAAGSGSGEFNEFSVSGGILSIGEWEPQIFRPESFSGSQSCWLEVPATQGSSFSLQFVSDAAGSPDDLSRYGWNMDVIYDAIGVGELKFPYRGIPPNDSTDDYDEANYPSTALGGDDFQTYIGTTLNHDEPTLSTGSLFVVRFQGVRYVGDGENLCTLNLNGPSVEPNSLTPWVEHPDMLNQFSPQPNVIRFTVIFDEQLAQYDPVIDGRIRGITNMVIRAQPL